MVLNIHFHSHVYLCVRFHTLVASFACLLSDSLCSIWFVFTCTHLSTRNLLQIIHSNFFPASHNDRYLSTNIFHCFSCFVPRSFSVTCICLCAVPYILVISFMCLLSDSLCSVWCVFTCISYHQELASNNPVLSIFLVQFLRGFVWLIIQMLIIVVHINFVLPNFVWWKEYK